MRSARVPNASRDDRSAKARIRDAAIACFAEHGVVDTTVRRIAEAADVSPGLVMHHFGSMGGLRRACDEHVASVIREYKDSALSSGPQLDLPAIIRGADVGPLVAYLSQVLTDGSPAVDRLVDELVDDAEVYLEHGVESGMLRPTGNPRGRAVMAALWSLGGLVLHRHMKRLLGVDLTSQGLATDPALLDYMRAAAEVMGTGLYTEEFAREIDRALASGTPEEADPQ